MFVYQSASNQVSPENRVKSFFTVNERWGDSFTSGTLIVVASALFFGALSKIVTLLPISAFVGTIGVLAWMFGERAGSDQPEWMYRLSLLSTGILYLGLGHCLGWLALPVIGAVLYYFNR